MNKVSNRAMYMNELRVLEITPIITCMKAKDLRRRVTLRTRKVRNILTALNAEIALPFPPDKNVISTIDKTTMIPSKRFILSLT